MRRDPTLRKRLLVLHLLVLGLSVLTVLLPGTAAAQTATQTFQLVPGWNAFHLEVQPEPRDPQAFFAGIASRVESVWVYEPQASTAEFVQADQQGLPGLSFNQPAWLPLIQPGAATAFASRVFAIQAGKTYLVRLSPGPPVDLVATGRPRLLPLSWEPNGFTLTGLPVTDEQASQPTFQSFFAASPEHAAQSVFRLDPAGSWQEIDPAATTIRAGEAYWIHTNGSSDFQGPLEVEVSGAGARGDLDYGETLSTQVVLVRNRTGSQANLTIENLGAVPLAYETVGQEGISFPDLPSPLVTTVDAGDDRAFEIAVRRDQLPPDGSEVQSVLVISDDIGTRQRIPVVAHKAMIRTSAGELAPSLAGLWVGNVILDKVSQAQPPAPDMSFDLQLGAIATVVENGVPRQAEDVLIDVGSQWRYWDQGPVDPAWAGAAFDDSSWPQGAAELGYGDRDPGGLPAEATEIDPGPAGARHPSHYFRRTFDVPLTSYSGLVLRLKRDDGAVVYLNGVEVLRSNMPEGAIAFDTRPNVTIGGGDESAFVEAELGALLLPGQPNVVAVSLHQHAREIADEDPAAVTATPAEFSMRLILHVDAAQQVRLLKQVIQMWEDGTYQPSQTIPGFQEPATPGRFVLVTDDSLIPQYQGTTLRDGRPVGQRISSAAFDFVGNELPLAGAFGPPGTLTGEIVVPESLPTHPFRHRYHPDHGIGASDPGVPEIRRGLEIQFTADDPTRPVPGPDANPLGWGDSLVGGVYRETLTGLHRDPISVEGPFVLRRVSITGELNQ
jgi:hypothetical protein